MQQALEHLEAKRGGGGGGRGCARSSERRVSIKRPAPGSRIGADFGGGWPAARCFGPHKKGRVRLLNQPDNTPPFSLNQHAIPHALTISLSSQERRRTRKEKRQTTQHKNRRRHQSENAEHQERDRRRRKRGRQPGDGRPHGGQARPGRGRGRARRRGAGGEFWAGGARGANEGVGELAASCQSAARTGKKKEGHDDDAAAHFHT